MSGYPAEGSRCAPAPGDRIGPYTLEHVLRDGNTTGCARGTDTDGTGMLLRWAPAEQDLGSSGLIGGPEAEYSALAAIPHQGVPRPVDLLRTGSRVWSVLEWVDGR